MTETLLSFDPGQVTGWSLWAFDDGHAFQRLEFGLIKGGLDGVLDWIERHLGLLRPSLTLVERFNPDLGDANKDYEAMLIMGALKAACRALGIDLEFQDIDMKALCRDEVLKVHGLWIDGPEVDHTDGRDVNDSEINALAWAKAHDHEPTVALYWPPM